MKVSISMITYNHERYIAQAINSVLMQEVSFDYELVIGEDCSTDNTRAVVTDLQQRYPDRIRLLVSETNIGAYANAARTLAACQGQYVAVLEGDDYWTSPHKLQRQVDFLDGHPECAMCFHNATLVNGDSGQELGVYCGPQQKEISTLEDLLVTNFMPSCSVMFRRGLFHELPDWVRTLPMGDWSINVINARHGKIGYINEKMASYRVHSGGLWSRLSRAEGLQAEIRFYQVINPYLGCEYDDIIQSMLADRWQKLAEILVTQGAQRGSDDPHLDNVGRIFDRWPPSVELPAPWKAQVLSRTYARLLFAAHQAGNQETSRYCLLRMLQYDRSWLRNRGIWSIAVEAFGGLHIANWLRGWARRALRS